MLKFEEKLQLSYQDMALFYDQEEIRDCKGEKSNNEVLEGIKFIFDPEKYVETGFSMSKLS